MNIQQIGWQLLLWSVSFVGCENLVQTLTATIGAENYTHYRLSFKGRLYIELKSIVGDADLYISDSTLSPTYDNYMIQSNTCGTEELIIPSSMKRPVGIGVYGHPNYELTEYRLSIYFLNEYDDMSYEQISRQFNRIEGDESDSEENTEQTSTFFSTQSQDEEEGESAWSILGTILSTILKIIFEILL